MYTIIKMLVHIYGVGLLRCFVLHRQAMRRPRDMERAIEHGITPFSYPRRNQESSLVKRIITITHQTVTEMKKIVSFLAASLLLVGFTACNNTKDKIIKAYEEGTEQVKSAGSLEEKQKAVEATQAKITEISKEDPSGVLKLADDKDFQEAYQNYIQEAGSSIMDQVTNDAGDLMKQANKDAEDLMKQANSSMDDF